MLLGAGFDIVLLQQALRLSAAAAKAAVAASLTNFMKFPLLSLLGAGAIYAQRPGETTKIEAGRQATISTGVPGRTRA